MNEKSKLGKYLVPEGTTTKILLAVAAAAVAVLGLFCFGAKSATPVTVRLALFSFGSLFIAFWVGITRHIVKRKAAEKTAFESEEQETHW